jgi:hypothetical protein
MTENKTNLFNWFQLSLPIAGCAVLGLKAFVPAANPYMPGGILLILLLLTMVGVLLCVGLNKFINYFLSSLLLFLVQILTLLKSFILGDGNTFSNLVTLMMLIVWPIFSSFLLEFRQDVKIAKMSKLLLLYMSALLILTMVTTYKGNLLFPGASRELAHYSTDETGMIPIYIKMNIGGFGFIYTLTLVLPLLAYWMKINAITGVVGVAIFVVEFLCIISSQYTIALLMSLVSVILAFFPKQIKRAHIFISASIFLLILITGPLIGNFFRYLSDVVEGTTLSSRLIEVYQLFSGGGIDSSSDTANRMNLINMSWNTFFDNLLFGSSDGLGEHSYLVDTLAQFGLFGLVAIILSFRYLFKKYVARLKKTELYYYAFACFIINLAQCYVNTFNGFVLFTLILPLFIVTFQERIRFQSLGNEKNN